MSDLVGNPEDLFSRVAAHIINAIRTSSTALLVRVPINKPIQILIYSTKKLRKMCSRAYYNKSSEVLEIQNSESYKVSFNLSSEALFELIAPALTGKIIVKAD